jgi:Outer membrane protein beta-barrel domain
MQFSIKFLLFFTLFNSFSQETKIDTTTIAIDSLYREDQFYFGVSLNLFQNKPQNFSVNKLSPSFALGFLRDMPINATRTKAIALGLGFSYSKFTNNLIVLEVDNKIQYTTTNTVTSYDKNKLEQLSIDIPLEIRWRNSTPQSHEFFRIYTGIKMSYLVFSKSKYIDSEKNSTVYNNQDLTKLRSTAYISFGLNTWNAYIAYGFSPIFKSSAKLNNDTIGLNPVNIGFMFYVL